MLISNERREIIKLLAKDKSTLEISKILKRDHKTVKRFIDDRKVKRKKNTKEVVHM